MLMFTLAISCLTTSNLPWFMDLTFQVPMQYCCLQHRTLLPSPVTSTAVCCFLLGSISLFLDVCDNKWVALDRNQDHSVIFVIEPKSCILGSYHLLLDHAQFTLIHGPNIPGSYAILLFTVSDFNFTTRHIHNWALLLLWPAALSFQELLVIAFWSSPVIYWIPSDYNKIFNSRL